MLANIIMYFLYNNMLRKSRRKQLFASVIIKFKTISHSRKFKCPIQILYKYKFCLKTVLILLILDQKNFVKNCTFDISL